MILGVHFGRGDVKRTLFSEMDVRILAVQDVAVGGTELRV